MTTAVASCVACGAADVVPWRTAPSFDPRAARASYGLVRCARCGTAMTLGRDGEEPALYRGGAYRPPSSGVDRLLEPLRSLGERSVAHRLRIPAGSTVLEVGAGDGRLLRLLRDHGCTTIGIDPYADTDGTGVARASLSEAGIEPGTADVVLVWHVLEHVGDPLPLVEEIARVLRPGGRLIVGVPRLDSLQSAVGGTRWFHLDVPRHATHFTLAGLRALLERGGFTVSGTSGVVVDQNLLGMTQTLLNRLTLRPNAGFRMLKGDRAGIPARDAAVTVLAAAPAALLGPAAESLAMLTGRAGSVVAHAVRAG